jgi:hypothetical protein
MLAACRTAPKPLAGSLAPFTGLDYWGGGEDAPRAVQAAKHGRLNGIPGTVRANSPSLGNGADQSAPPPLTYRPPLHYRDDWVPIGSTHRFRSLAGYH